MPRIVLATLNARYIHASFGLRYLHANLGPLAAEAAILEFEARQDTLSIVERILAASPRIIGFGVYIWNVAETRRVVDLIKRIAPETVVVVGGPEVSHELESESLDAPLPIASPTVRRRSKRVRFSAGLQPSPKRTVRPIMSPRPSIRWSVSFGLGSGVKRDLRKPT